MHQFASACLALGNVKVFNPETFFAWLKVSSSFPLQKNSLPFFPFSLYPQNYLTTLHYVTSRWGLRVFLPSSSPRSPLHCRLMTGREAHTRITETKKKKKADKCALRRAESRTKRPEDRKSDECWKNNRTNDCFHQTHKSIRVSLRLFSDLLVLLFFIPCYTNSNEQSVFNKNTSSLSFAPPSHWSPTGINSSC